MQLTPKQQTQIQKLPPNKQIKPVTPPLVGQPGAPAGAHAPMQPGVQPGGPAHPGVAQPGGKPGRCSLGWRLIPAPSRPVEQPILGLPRQCPADLDRQPRQCRLRDDRDRPLLA